MIIVTHVLLLDIIEALILYVQKSVIVQKVMEQQNALNVLLLVIIEKITLHVQKSPIVLLVIWLNVYNVQLMDIILKI